MARFFVRLIFACLLCGAGYSQSTDTPDRFEAADVRLSPKTNRPFMSGGISRDGRYLLHFASIVDLISMAYSVQPDDVVGGPSWLEMQRYDIVAKAPPRTKADAAKPMLQELLKERFHLTLRNEKRPMPAYALTAEKHPSLKKSEEDGTPGCDFKVEGMGPNGPENGSAPMLTFDCHRMTMPGFAEYIRTAPGAQQFLNNFQVVDQTGLEGRWDFKFKFSIRGMPGANAQTITVAEALEKQLGLKLEASQVPLPVLVVESVDRTPVPDPPDTAAKLGAFAQPDTFEVADVKPTDADFKGTRFQLQPGGKVNIQGATLKMLVEQVYNYNDDMVAGGPKWIDNDRFDIVAKAPTLDLGTGPGTTNRPPVDVEALLQMLKNLIVERFQLKTHTEERPINAYTLIAVKPKMKEADPNSRTHFKEGPATLNAKDPRNTNSALSRLVTCQNMTMAEFAEELRMIAPGYIHSPVLDQTGLKGGYDFTLSFSPIGLMQNGGRGGRGAEGAGGDAGRSSDSLLAASDPGTGMTLLDAIEKQLGLKLVQQKRPVEVMVIDSAAKPVE